MADDEYVEEQSTRDRAGEPAPRDWTLGPANAEMVAGTWHGGGWRRPAATMLRVVVAAFLLLLLITAIAGVVSSL